MLNIEFQSIDLCVEILLTGLFCLMKEKYEDEKEEDISLTILDFVVVKLGNVVAK